MIIETRVMIKKNGVWEFGDYVWNASQTEASFNPDGATLLVSYIENSGTTQSINYKIPSQEDCFTYHQANSQPTLIGPKLKSMNFVINGSNQLQNSLLKVNWSMHQHHLALASYQIGKTNRYQMRSGHVPIWMSIVHIAILQEVFIMSIISI